MDEQENVQSDNKQFPVEDLTVKAVEAGEVKGGTAIYRNVNGTRTLISA